MYSPWWFIVLISTFLTWNCLCLQITTKPELSTDGISTGQVSQGQFVSVSLTEENGEPRNLTMQLVNEYTGMVYLIDKEVNLISDMEISFLVPFVPPSPHYTVRMIDSMVGNCVAESAPFEILAGSFFDDHSYPAYTADSRNIFATNSSSSTPTTHSNHVGAIVGGVVGGVAALALVIGTLTYLYLRRRRLALAQCCDCGDVAREVSPFVAPSPTSTTISHKRGPNKSIVLPTGSVNRLSITSLRSAPSIVSSEQSRYSESSAPYTVDKVPGSEHTESNSDSKENLQIRP